VTLICRARNLLANARRPGIIETIIHFISPPEQIFGNALLLFGFCVAPVFYVRPFWRESGDDYSMGVTELEVFAREVRLADVASGHVLPHHFFVAPSWCITARLTVE